MPTLNVSTEPHEQSTEQGPSRPAKLSKYLNNLALRPSNESPADAADDSDLLNTTTAFPSSVSSNRLSTTGAPQASQSPDSDSFEYIETLVEALAVLGKLGSGVDTIAQRLPLELFNLVETTVNEVRERAELGRRGSVNASAMGHTMASIYGHAPTDQQPVAADELRLPALESHAKGPERDALSDLFWTLYSKLDAVIQGLRVLYEVSNRVGSVSRPALENPRTHSHLDPSGGTSKTPQAQNLVQYFLCSRFGAQYKTRYQHSASLVHFRR